jgi:hypothetical protein
VSSSQEKHWLFLFSKEPAFDGGIRAAMPAQGFIPTPGKCHFHASQAALDKTRFHI